jgi:phosphate transport system substrate-binding protein
MLNLLIFNKKAIITAICILALGITSRAYSESGSIRIDGSSTVFPISEGIAEEFSSKNPKIRVTVGTSGTGGGFKKFTAGETDISNASRPISTSESAAAKKNGVTFMELPIAIDGLAVVVHPSNKFLQSLTIHQLKQIWEPGSKIQKWSDVDPKFPNEKIALFGPGPDSGTFDYFTEAVVGKPRASRTDYTASEDDNILIKGVAGSKFGLAYFGHGYYMANQSRVKAVFIDAGKGAIEPTDANVEAGKYPLARHLYIYVSGKSMARPEVLNFVNFYLDHAAKISKETGYLPLPADETKKARDRFAKKEFGSVHSK